MNTDNLNGRNNKRMWQPFFIGSTLAEKLAKGSYTTIYSIIKSAGQRGFLDLVIRPINLCPGGGPT